MAIIRNPCESEDPPVHDDDPAACPFGQRRSALTGECIPITDIPSEPDGFVAVPPAARNPFAVNTNLTDPNRASTPGMIDQLSDANQVITPQAPGGFLDEPPPNDPLISVLEIPYISATRDLTTIDENNFFSIGTLSPRGLVNHSSIWLAQKTDEGVRNQVDRFRVALFNFWNFDGESEKITARPIGNTRVPGGWRAGDASFWAIAVALHQNGAQSMYEALPLNDNQSPDYSLMENIPFKFQRSVVDRAKAQLPDNTKDSHLMDIYMAGSNSTVWSSQARDGFWGTNPEQRELYRSGNIEFDRPFFDYVFDAPAAFFESEMNNILISPSDSADVTVMAADQNLHAKVERETEIPNVYQYYQSKQTERLINSDLLLEANLPPGLIEYNQRLIANYEEFENEVDFDSSPSLKFPSDKVEQLEKINEVVRGSLTNFVEISINTTNAGPINALLQRNKMDTVILEILKSTTHLRDSEPGVGAGFGADALLPNQLVLDQSGRRKFTKVLDDQFVGENSNNTINATVNDRAEQGVEEVVVANIDKLISVVSDDSLRAFSWPRNLEEYPLGYTGWQNKRLTMFEETIRSQIFLDRMNQHIRQGKLERSFTDILYGRKAYSEVIGYKIEKHRIERNAQGQEDESKVQEFFLMDNDNIDKVNFLDTQVIPNKKYRYKIFTINFVIGTKYEYDGGATFYSWRLPAHGPRQSGHLSARQVKDNDILDGQLSINVRSGRSISLLYAPFFEKVVSLADKPPITPQVTFLPYQGVDDRHAILLQANYGEETAQPIKIFEEDEPIITGIFRSQNRQPGDEVLYKSDSLPTEFEVIRIDTVPESYEDFSQARALKIRKQASGKTGFFKLDIEPNKHYYYIFRTYDKGGVSNPSEVFRIRMVSYQNGIFMELEPYEMYKKPKEFKISFEKVIKISPSMEQKMINFEQVFQEIETASPENRSTLSRLRSELGLKTRVEKKIFQLTAPPKEKITLGSTTVESSVWDKKFKIRCISKTTGKKIDYNITFNKKKTTLLNEE
jgi:hypothetical protein